MSTFDRDASIERKQIHEISLNVARRLRHVLDRNHYIPAAMRPEVDSTVRVISGIQRDIEQIMGALPADEGLDFAILTHIMGGQRHALDLLEILEEKLDGGRGPYQRDSARVHQALLAVSREIEQDALRYAADSPAVPFPQAPPADRRGPARVPSPNPRQAGSGGSAPWSRKQPKPSRPAATPGVGIVGAMRSFAQKPAPVALAALTVGAGLVVAVQKFMPTGGEGQQPVAMLSPQPERKTDGVEPAQNDRPNAPANAARANIENVAITRPDMEQPYLVVLATRRSTEELQQDYRSFKGTYPELLGSAKARVDRVQGQDKQTYYRLSLIPPRAHDDAKALCRSLRSAGLTGCWIKPVPLH